VAPTVLHALVHPLLTLSTPLVLRSHFLLDRELAPTTFSAARFCASTVALLLKLPLETVLRRGQAAVLADPAYRAALEAAGSSAQGGGGGGRRLGSAAAAPAASAAGGELETVVPVGRYDGVFGTMYAIVYEEGSHAVAGGGSSRAAGSGPKKGKAASPPPTTTTTTTTVAETVYRRGQGLDGLWRGWKVSWWGLVGLWAAGVLGGGGDGEF
jgi:fusion and transport protein UGO1